MRKHFLIVLLILLATGKIAAQNITGTVVDTQNEPIPGVSVIVKGTSNGTATDTQGKFELNVADASTKALVFVFLGYQTQERAIGRNANFNIVLEENLQQLQDVVVIGYGVQKKSVVTGAISQVTSQSIENKQITRLDQALQGMTSGVAVAQSSGAPGAAPTIRVRGTTSINNSDPVYVIDGVVMNGGLDYLNPNDIQSIEVLKDAGSAAIYGTRAANGVIIVTTKKGNLNAPTRINYDMQMGFQGPANKVKLTNATQYAMLRNESVLNDGGMVPFPSPTIYGTGTNWQDEIFSNDALYQNHHLSLNGGSDKSTYFLALGYIGQKGIVSPSLSYNNRWSLTTNTSFKIGKYVTVGENLSYTYAKSFLGNMNANTEFGGPLSSALNLDPITPVYVDAATGASYPQYALQTGDGRYYGISQYVGQEVTNPVAWNQTQYGYDWSHNIIANGYINVNPIQGLNLRTQISAKKAFWGHEGFTPLYYLNANNSNTNQVSQGRNTEQNLSWNWDNYISYDKKIGLHSLGLMAGMSAIKQNGQHSYVTYLGEPVTNFDEASFNFNLSQDQRLASASDDQTYALTSYFGRVTYNYDERYLFMGILRRDGSSKFGSNNRWGTFPSVQLGWVVTREKFFPQKTALDNLKIRFSYGTVGNEMSLSNFQFTSIISGGGNKNYVFGSNNLAIGYSPSAPSNPDLKWEQTRSSDVGFDAILFKNFTFTFDYYYKKTKDMLMQVQIPGFAGYSDQPWANIGDLSNKGVEFEAGYVKNFGSDFRLNVKGNVSYNKNKIIFLGDNKEYLDGGAQLQNSAYRLTRIAIGHPVGAFYGLKNLGTFKSQDEINAYGYTDSNGNFQLYQPNAQPGDLKWWKNPDNPDDGGNGVIGQGDRTFIGDPTPHWMYGLTLNFGWKNWDLMAFGQGVWGNQIFQGYRRLDITNANYPIEALNAWTPLNPNSNYPRLSDTDRNGNFTNTSDFYLQSGAYFRLKTLQVGYSLPKAWMSAIGFQKVRIYGSVSNLFTATNYTGYDPEIGGTTGVAQNGQNNGNYGIDYAIYPQARTFIFGLNVEF
ncbi:MAG: TonB-dependent receptor [Candidatus Azobacteroides sp.]|nr:TonB-dependent receptor [Candidatus Azobacteroides sp.]